MRWLSLAALLLLACPPAVPKVVGLACAKHEECKALPDAYCARAGACTRECRGGADAGCPEGSVCVVAGQRPVCLATCGSSVSCVAGLSCSESDAGAVCTVVDALVPVTVGPDAG